MTLDHLGWQPFFDTAFKPYAGEFQVGRIAVQQTRVYELWTEAGVISAEMSGNLRKSAEIDSTLRPVVGDWVVIQLRLAERFAVIHHVLPRRTKFSRKVTEEVTREQVIAANIDIAFLVSGLDQDFNLRRLERYLLTAQHSGAEPVIVLNKVDLCAESDARLSEVRAIAPSVPIITMSAMHKQGIALMNFYLGQGKTGCLLGSSGVGKSTIINALLDDDVQSTRTTRKDMDRGRHTTTHRELFVLPGGGLLMDTPGMRELQLWTDESSLSGTFEDIETLAAACRFRDCRHESEPDCAVQAALADGSLDAARYKSYLKLRREIRYLELRQDNSAARLEKMRWKKIHAQHKKNNRSKN